MANQVVATGPKAPVVDYIKDCIKNPIVNPIKDPITGR
jgi:hypothetical protein